MQKILVYWIIPFFTIGMILFLVFFLYSLNTTEDLVSYKFDNNEKTLLSKQSKEEENSWVSYLYKKEFTQDQLPVINTYIELELDRRVQFDTVYNLKVPMLDPYQFFCLKQVFLEFDVRYHLEKHKQHLLIYIETKNKFYAKQLVDALQKYDISSEITYTIRRNDAKI